MNRNLHLIQLRNGDWIDPLAVTCLVAGSNAREYRAPDGKTFAAFLRIETRHGSMMCPCNDYAGGSSYVTLLRVYATNDSTAHL
jgi:hypothetical protein